MEFETNRIGKIYYNKSDIIWMTKGMLGFEGFKRFVLISPDEQEPFKWLQSIEDPAPAFLVIESQLIKPDYKIEISPKDMALLEAQNWKELVIYLLATIPNGHVEAITVNLQAPIIINKAKMFAAQLIVSESGYSTQYPIFKVLEQKQ